MPGYVIHVPALGEKIVNFTKIGIINNLRYSSSRYSGRFSNLFLEPSEAAQSEDNCVSAGFLPGADVGDPCVDGLLDNSYLFRKG